MVTELQAKFLLILFLDTYSTDFEDPNESKILKPNVKSCYELCLTNLNCLAITWNNSICILKTSIDKPKPCDETITCIKMLSKFYKA